MKEVKYYCIMYAVLLFALIILSHESCFTCTNYSGRQIWLVIRVGKTLLTQSKCAVSNFE